jgi:heme oxygenase
LTQHSARETIFLSDENHHHEEHVVIEQLVLDSATQPEVLLSAQLRAQTACLHRAIEDRLGLPSSIRTRDDYIAWLGRFYGFYDPLEARLAALTSESALDPMLQTRRQTPGLRRDLRALGVDPGSRELAPAAILPSLPDFAAALGAYYVLEGSTLGGVFILRDLEARLGDAIAGATQFFGGRGKSIGPMWHSFRAELDAYGQTRPRHRADVVTGAQQTFKAMLVWCASP